MLIPVPYYGSMLHLSLTNLSSPNHWKTTTKNKSHTEKLILKKKKMKDISENLAGDRAKSRNRRRQKGQ